MDDGEYISNHFEFIIQIIMNLPKLTRTSLRLISKMKTLSPMKDFLNTKSTEKPNPKKESMYLNSRVISTGRKSLTQALNMQ